MAKEPKDKNQIDYVVKDCFRPAVIAQAAKECRLDVGMKASVGLLQMAIRPVGKELNRDDVREFENRLRQGQVEFRRKGEGK